jgi:hypothetical protein
LGAVEKKLSVDGPYFPLFQPKLFGVFFRARSLTFFLLVAVFLVSIPLLLWLFKSGVFKKGGWSGLRMPVNSLDSRSELDLLWLNTGVCVCLLVSSLVHYHYFVLTIPCLLMLFRFPDGIPRLPFLKQAFLGLAVFALMAIRAPYIGNGHDALLVDWRLAYIGTVWLYIYGLYHLCPSWVGCRANLRPIGL